MTIEETCLFDETVQFARSCGSVDAHHLLQLHCAKSCRPFELFVNENHKLQNEAKMNVTFERGSA